MEKNADKELKKALTGGVSGSGEEWDLDELSSNLIELAKQDMMVSELFRQRTMNTSSVVITVGIPGATAYKVSDSTEDAPASRTFVTASQPTSSNLTLTAVRLKSRVALGEDFEEDATAESLAFTRKDMADQMSRAVEEAIINGDDSVSHMDSDVTSSADARTSWKGLRKMAIAGSLTQDISTFGISDIRKLRKLLGQYGIKVQDLAFIAGNKVYNKLLGLTEVTTVDKYGPNATILTGELAKLDGIPVIVSGEMRENLNASGVYDGSTTSKATLLLVNKKWFIKGFRKPVVFSRFIDTRVGANDIISTWRGDFKPVVTPSATYPFVAMGINIDIS